MAGYRNGGRMAVVRSRPTDAGLHPHIIAFANRDALHAEQIIGGGDMEKQVGQEEAQHIGLAVQIHGLPVPTGIVIARNRIKRTIWILFDTSQLTMHLHSCSIFPGYGDRS